MLVAVGCEPVTYGFAPDDDDTIPPDSETVDDTCEDLAIEHVVCGVDAGAVVGCFDLVKVNTEVIDESAGCTPAGQALGIASFGTSSPGVGEIDVYAWIEAPPTELGPFADDLFLSVFEDKCGDDPFGESEEPVCEYEPWLTTPDVPSDASLYLHVQSLAPSVAGAPIELHYQVRSSGDWTWPLPAGEELNCLYPIDSPEPGPQRAALLDSPPWDSAWHEIDLTGAPPAFHGDPRICPAASGGWRQVAYQLRNQGDEPLTVTEISVGRRLSPLSLERVPFHFEIASCIDSISAEGGVIEPGQEPLASSCHDDGDHASKQMNLTIVPWNPMLPSTQYTLILQVPPSAGVELEVRIQTEPH